MCLVRRFHRLNGLLGLLRRTIAPLVVTSEIVAISAVTALTVIARFIFVATVFAFELVVGVAALRALIFKAGAGFVEHAKIMVRELQIILCRDTVACHLGVARQILVLLVKLLRVAAGAIVDPVAAARLSGISLRPRAATTATTAAVLTIIDQRMSSTSPKNMPVPLVGGAA
jgi:hypothetical protein